MSRQFGVKLVINPEAQATMEIARQLKYPGFLKRDVFAKARVEIVELKIEEGSRLADVNLMDLQKTVRCQVLICAVLRDGKCIMPGGDFTLKAGDRIFVTGASSELHSLLRNIGIITSPVRHVMVAGGGRISYYLALELEKSGITSTIIEQDKAKCDALAEVLPDATVICGDASDHSVLESEEIGSYDGFVSLTGIDELNIVMSMHANIAGVPQIVTKLGRGSNTQLMDRLPIGAVVCPKELCTMHIVRYVRALQNQKGAAITIHRIADNQAEAIEFSVDGDTRHIGETLKDIHMKRNILVVSIGHGKHTEIPNGSSTYKKGDTIVVVTAADTPVLSLNDIFED